MNCPENTPNDDQALFVVSEEDFRSASQPRSNEMEIIDKRTPKLLPYVRGLLDDYIHAAQ